MSARSDEDRSLQSSESFQDFDSEKSSHNDKYTEGDYAESSKLSFQDLLKIHHKQTVWGFQFGKEVRESITRDKNPPQTTSTTVEVDRLSDDDGAAQTTISGSDVAAENAGTSKAITERDHKTPHSRRRAEASRSSKRKNSSKQDFVSPQKTRRAPLPLMHWADSKEVWLFMVYKEEASLNLRNPSLFEEFTDFIPRMRAILLDWVVEVCEVCHLRRVTYYLSVDYFDRFLSIRPDVPKNQLQLVGVTCLFLASKLEEVFAPKLTEFSYVCDGACSPEEILACELLILNSLGWDLNIMTASDWLNLYMQIHFQAGTVAKQKLHVDMNRDFFFPQYSGYQFTRASQLIDMFSLDPGFLKFSYSAIAAAAMYFMYGKKAALAASGLTWSQLQPCAEYMAVFYHVLRDSPDPRLQSCKGDEQNNATLDNIRHSVKNLVKDENHSLQSHVVNMEYFEKSAIVRLEQMGLKVERTYVKKKKSDDKSDVKEDEEEEEEEAANDDHMICMYELEKLSCDAVALSDEDVDVTAPTTSDADLVMPDDDKALLSFDDILEGIVKCNRKNIPVQLQTSREFLEETINRLD